MIFRLLFRPWCVRFSFKKWFWVALVSCLLVIAVSPAAIAQLFDFQNATNGNIVPGEVTRIGNIETIVVKSGLDGQNLFTIASPAVNNRDDITETLPVEVRAEQIRRTVNRAGLLLQDAKQPMVIISKLNNLTVLQATDQDQKKRRINLVTVTNLDAEYNGLDVEQLAEEWQDILQEELDQVLHLYSVEELLERTWRSLRVLIIIGIASIIIWKLQQWLSRYLEHLNQQQQQIETTEETTPLQNRIRDPRELNLSTTFRNILLQQQQFLQNLKRQPSKKFYNYLLSARWLLFWSQFLIWYIGIGWIISIHPFLMQWHLWFWNIPLDLLMIWFFASLGLRLSYSLIDRFTQAWNRTDFLSNLLSLAEMQRKELRGITIAGVLRSIAFASIITIAVIWSLESIGVPTRSLLAGGAIIALAVSFGAQSLVQDLVNGCLIILEDQFAVGDVVEIGSASGLVENLNLRSTLLRDTSGALIAIPNRSITEVKNLTRLWSRVDFSIEIAHQANLTRALEVLKLVGEEFFADPDWHNDILEPPELLGVNNVSHTGITLAVWIKTEPLRQWAVGREFRYRVCLAFEENDIAIASVYPLVIEN